MIDLTPISEKIQKRMFEKMDILGRENTSVPGKSNSESVEHGLTLAKMSTRSTFIRMTSGQINPVVLMGGELIPGGNASDPEGNLVLGYGGDHIASGYDEIYGSRLYQGTEDWDEIGQNENKRPMPGIKSIEASFKGGLRALREATISWTCWSWDDLNRLMPHFLAHGKTVLVQWGWVYDENTLTKLPNFLKEDNGNKFISADAYENYQNTITEADGDFDLMVGIIKNFEFTTRDDGGFDCQTIITSVGASILEATQPNESVLDPGISYNLSFKEDTKELTDKIEKATGEEGTSETADSKKTGDKSTLIDLNTSVTLKYFIRKIDEYVVGRLLLSNKYHTSVAANETAIFKYDNNKFINLKITSYDDTVDLTELSANESTENPWVTWESLYDDTVESTENTWVTWGWFEDNILSKFLSTTSDSTDRPIVTEFRSIERGTLNGKVAAWTVPVRIKNHSELETVDINHYILPGQFNPQKPTIAAIPKLNSVTGKIIGTRNETLPGDTEGFLQDLAWIVNETKDFEPFAAGTDTIKVFEDVWETKEITKTEHIWDYGKIWNPFDDRIVDTKEVGTGEFLTEKSEKKEKVDVIVPGKYGYLRNMLINTKLIKQAFGVLDGDLTAEPINIVESIETLLSLLNSKLNFWNFNLEVDSTDTYRAKIVDTQVTNFDFDEINREKKTVWDKRSTKDTPNGVFFFPTWKHNSFVKRQNITAKIPTALQLSIMYGSNMDQLKDFANPGSQFANKSGVAVAGLFNDSKNLDEKLGGLNIAFKNKNHRNIGGTELGNGQSSPNSPLKLNIETENIEQFLIDNSKDLELAYEERLKDIAAFLKQSKEAKELEDIGTFDSSVPAPLVDNLSPEEIGLLIQFSKQGWFGGVPEGSFLALLSSKFFASGEMKSTFIKSVNYLTTQHGKYKNANTPIIIPLELELDIDGIGGIYPGNSFHSTYVPKKYQDKTLFQIFDVNHRVDGSGWSVAIRGKMRTNMSTVFDGYEKLEELKDNMFKNFLDKAVVDNKKEQMEQALRQQRLFDAKYGEGFGSFISSIS
jgi:hypothetical protein